MRRRCFGLHNYYYYSMVLAGLVLISLVSMMIGGRELFGEMISGGGGTNKADDDDDGRVVAAVVRRRGGRGGSVGGGINKQDGGTTGTTTGNSAAGNTDGVGKNNNITDASNYGDGDGELGEKAAGDNYNDSGLDDRGDDQGDRVNKNKIYAAPPSSISTGQKEDEGEARGGDGVIGDNDLVVLDGGGGRHEEIVGDGPPIDKQQEETEAGAHKEREETGGNTNATADIDDMDDADGICERSKTDFRSASGLFAIVTGCHHSGTTVASQFIMSSPDLFGAVECGMLDCRTPKEFLYSPYYVRTSNPAHWQLSKRERPLLLRAGCHAEMYRLLRRRSPLFRHPVTSNSMIVDKAPRYVYDLVNVMDRSPGVPVVVTQKDDEYQIRSCMKYGHQDDRDGCEALVNSMKINLRQAREKYPRRIHVVNTTALYSDPDRVMSAAYEFLNLTRGAAGWKREYLSMDAVNEKKRAVGGGLLYEMAPFDATAIQNNHKTSRFSDMRAKQKQKRNRKQQRKERKRQKKQQQQEQQQRQELLQQEQQQQQQQQQQRQKHDPQEQKQQPE